MTMHSAPTPPSEAELALLFDRNDPRPVHFVGIAGAGMSALAELFARRGIAVSGCDANLAGTADLLQLGIHMVEGHHPSHVENSRALVVTSAMPKEHPELVAARAAGLPVIRRAEALGAAVNRGRLVAVAGTHGKTTTTTMTTEALRSAGLNPTGVVGARVAAWSGNLLRGGDDLFVVEADEYDRSFLALVPTVAVITNVEADHLDIYKDLADIRANFARFAEPARFVVRCADDAGARSVPLPGGAEVIGYGVVSPEARLVARDVAQSAAGTRAVVAMDGRPLGELHLRVPGLHN
ncbi:MAG: UDP-N-acetylmuramate--L-alanine ligase, partial [Gemmatimonadetes bacterium]|nr:UDP-N-acetylmuramate--L-alanine ligase [Gemmatimonadota bacterium]